MRPSAKSSDCSTFDLRCGGLRCSHREAAITPARSRDDQLPGSDGARHHGRARFGIHMTASPSCEIAGRDDRYVPCLQQPCSTAPHSPFRSACVVIAQHALAAVLDNADRILAPCTSKRPSTPDSRRHSRRLLQLLNQDGVDLARRDHREDSSVSHRCSGCEARPPSQTGRMAQLLRDRIRLTRAAVPLRFQLLPAFTCAATSAITRRCSRRSSANLDNNHCLHCLQILAPSRTERRRVFGLLRGQLMKTREPHPAVSSSTHDVHRCTGTTRSASSSYQLPPATHSPGLGSSSNPTSA